MPCFVMYLGEVCQMTERHGKQLLECGFGRKVPLPPELESWGSGPEVRTKLLIYGNSKILIKVLHFYIIFTEL